MTAFDKLMNLILRLEEEFKVPYEISHAREDALMVTVQVPGHKWEIEVFANGEVEIEVFTSPGHIYDESKLNELFEILKD